MARDRTVLQSVNAPDGLLCVDLFRRGDGSFGFEEYRRDPEDPRGWFAVGGHAARTFASRAAALDAARAAVAWLPEALS